MSLKCSFKVIFSITLPLLLPTLTHLKSIWVMTLYHFKHFCNLLAPRLLWRLKRPLKSLRQSLWPFKLQLHVQAVTQVTRLCYTCLGYNPPRSGYSHICYPRSDGFYWLETLRPWSSGPQESANMKEKSQIPPPRMLLPIFPHYILPPYFSFQLLQHLLYPNLRRNFKTGVCHFFNKKFLIFIFLYTVLTCLHVSLCSFIWHKITELQERLL